MPVNQTKKRTIIINFIVTVIVFVLSIIYLTCSKIITIDSILSIKFIDYLIVFIYFILTFLLITLVDYLVYKNITKKMNYGRCFLNVISGNLGSCITPFRAGHFPLKIYYQTKAGINIVNTLTGFVKAQIVYSVTSIVVYSIMVIYLGITGQSIVFEGQTVSLWLVVFIGLFFHILVFCGNIIFSFCKPIQNWVLSIWIYIYAKFKKNLNRLEYLKEKQQRFDIFRNQISELIKEWYNYLLSVLLYAVYMLLSSSTQYIAFIVFAKEQFAINGLFTFYVLSLASTYITNIIPVPGGFGTTEIVFTLIFASIIPEGIIGSVLVLWRMSSYYIVIVLELIIFTFCVFNKRKNILDKTN